MGEKRINKQLICTLTNWHYHPSFVGLILSLIRSKYREDAASKHMILSLRFERFV